MKEKDSYFNLQNQNILYDNIKQGIISLPNINNIINNPPKRNNIKNTRLFLKSDNLSQLKSNNIKKALNLIYSKTKLLPVPYLEKIIYKRFYKFYHIDKNFYNIKVINEIISNDSSHIVAEFKDFLIKDDFSEFLQKYYTLKDSLLLLNQIFEYYKLSSVVYPNYILLSENKYIYKNIQKKQKIIDEQQEQEEKINDNEQQINNNWTDRNKIYNNKEKVFDSIIIDSILNQSNTSQIQKCVFGISNNNSLDIDIEYNNLFGIVKNINKAEDNCYSKFIEKNKLINSNNNQKESNNKINNKLNNKQTILNTNKIQINNKNKEFFSNNIKKNGNKIISRNSLEFNNLGKTHSNFILNINNNKKNLNNKGKNIYSLFINKDKGNPILKLNNNNISRNTSNSNNYYAFSDKNENLTTENINNNVSTLKKYKLYGKNKRNILDYIINKDISQLKTILKSDYSLNEKHKNKYINDKEKDKSDKNIKNVIGLDKIKFANKYMEKKANNENNKYIKKTVINELLSLCSSSKETSRTFKMTESQRELKYSNNKTEKEKKSIKYINNLKTNANQNSLISNNIYKFMNNTTRLNNYRKKNKEISLDIDSKKMKRNFNKHSENNIIDKMNNNLNKTSNKNIYLLLNTNNERVSLPDNKYERINGYLSGKYISSNENNYNLINNKGKDKNKNILINNENDSNIESKISNLKIGKYNKISRNRTNLNYKNLTYSMINVKKFLNNNSQNTNNKINNNGSIYLGGYNIVNPKVKISANSINLKDNLKLNLNSLNQF